MTVSAGIGIANFNFDDTKGFWKWIDLCDSSGVDSIWQSDRIISTDANLECMSVMAALAGRTKRIKFGMNVASLGLRDPVLTAKQCATIDVLSDGRLLPAFGIGSSRSRDYVATGTPTAGRGKRMDEGLVILSRLWRVLPTGRSFDHSETRPETTTTMGWWLLAQSHRTHRALGNGLASWHRIGRSGSPRHQSHQGKGHRYRTHD